MTINSLETLIRAIELDSQLIDQERERFLNEERQRLQTAETLYAFHQENLVEDMLMNQERERFLNEERQRLQTAETLYAFHQENLVKEQQEL